MNSETFSWFVKLMAWTLIHSLWQGAVVAAGLVVGLWAMRRTAASWRHGWALAGTVMMAMCPAVTVVRLTTDAWSQESSSMASDEPRAQPGGMGWKSGSSFFADAAALDDRPEAPKSESTSVIRPSLIGNILSVQSLPLVAAWWVAGVIGMSVWRAAGWWRLRQWRRGAESMDDLRIESLKARMGVQREVRIGVTRRAVAPLLIGSLKPLILLPASVVNGLSPRQLEAVLAHELAHLQRRDDWAVLMQSLVESLMFYHPAVWWIGGVLRREREFAADDRAAAVIADRTDYARAMVRLAELCLHCPSPDLGATSGGPMITRVKRLLSPLPVPAEKVRAPWIAAASILALPAFAVVPAGLPPATALVVASTSAAESTLSRVADGGPDPAAPAAPRAGQPSSGQPTDQRHSPTIEEGEAAAEVAKAFLRAGTMEGKLTWVRFPEKVRPLMEQWYQQHPIQPVQASRDDLAESLTKFIHVDGTTFLVVTLLTSPEGEYKFLALEVMPESEFKVDWETSSGWQPMPLTDFLNQRPNAPQTLRVMAAPGDYYNGSFSDAARWCCINLTHPGHRDFRLFGYVERNSPTGERLMKLLGINETVTASGEAVPGSAQPISASLILSIAYPRGGGDPKQVIIHEMVHDQWFLTAGPAGGR